jgi:hypothetical protein
MHDLALFLSGAVVGFFVFWFWAGADPEAAITPPRDPGWQMGCGYTIQHVCRCVLPHGHVVRIHTCQHRDIYAEDSARADVIGNN